MVKPQNAWVRKKINQVKVICENPICDSVEKLEFAHIKPTKLSGRGRGRNKRYQDFVKNCDCYKILCNECHKAYRDGFLNFEVDYLEYGDHLEPDKGLLELVH